MTAQRYWTLLLGEIFLVLCILFDFVGNTDGCGDGAQSYSLGACPRATVSFVSLILADALFLLSYLLAPTQRLSAHWRHLLLFSVTSAILVIMIVFHSLGAAHIVDVDLRYYLGSILAFTLMVTWLKTFFLFPLNFTPTPLDPRKRGPHGIIGTHSFTIPVPNPDDPNLTYRAAVQVWFPLPQRPSGSAPHSLLWTSGNPASQEREATALSEMICQEFNQLWFVLSHLALNKHSRPPIYYTDMHHAPPKDSPSAGTTGSPPSGAGAETEGDTPYNSDSNPSSAVHPVAIYSHGLFSWRQLATSTVIQLVSHGFVVFSIDHSPSAMVARLPATVGTGGGSEEQGPNGGSGWADGASGAASVKDPSGCDEASDGEEFLKFDFRLPKGYANTPQERLFYSSGLERRTLELLALMDFLDREQAGRLRSYRIDTSRLHLFGHSFGSGTVASVCARDARPVSAVLLDSWMFPISERDMGTGSKRAAVLSLASDLWDIGPSQIALRTRYMESTRRTQGAQDAQTFQLKVQGTDHQNFCDIFMLADKSLLKGASRVPDLLPLLFSSSALLSSSHLLIFKPILPNPRCLPQKACSAR